MKLIELYKGWMKAKRLPNSGLCNSLNGKYESCFDNYFHLSLNERTELMQNGYDFTYWASGLPSDHKDEELGFTPLRQTIILLICAMHNEL